MQGSNDMTGVYVVSRPDETNKVSVSTPEELRHRPDLKTVVTQLNLPPGEGAWAGGYYIQHAEEAEYEALGK